VLAASRSPRLLDLCGITDTLIADEASVYHPWSLSQEDVSIRLEPTKVTITRAGTPSPRWPWCAGSRWVDRHVQRSGDSGPPRDSGSTSAISAGPSSGSWAVDAAPAEARSAGGMTEASTCHSLPVHLSPGSVTVPRMRRRTGRGLKSRTEWRLGGRRR
jgi:hypothetical protein